jgi:hypothetical protein
MGVMLTPAGDQGNGLGIVLYDNTPGGAGHVRELLDRGQQWLQAARTALFVDEEHDAHCNTACIDCILTFGAQQTMQSKLLNRRTALAVLDALLANKSLPIAHVAEHPITQVSQQEAPRREERLRLAKERLDRRRRS